MRNAIANDSRVDWTGSVARPREGTRRSSSRRYLPAGRGRPAGLGGYRRALRRRRARAVSSPLLIVAAVMLAGGAGGLLARALVPAGRAAPARASVAASTHVVPVAEAPVIAAPAGVPDAAAAPAEAAPGVVSVSPPFDDLAAADYTRRLGAFAALLPRVTELRAEAFVEASVLRRQLQAGRDVPVRALEALEDLRAEAEVLQVWRPGLPATAAALAGVKLTVDQQRVPVGEALAAASRNWGVRIELSPGARRLLAALDLELSGETDLEGFLRWVCVDRSRTYGGLLLVGHVGERIVLVPAESLPAARGPDAGGDD